MSQTVELELSGAQAELYRQLVEEYGEARVVAVLENKAIAEINEGIHNLVKRRARKERDREDAEE